MTEDWLPSDPAAEADAAAIDTTVPHIARIYDYWLGGRDNYQVDRLAARRAIDAYPGIVRGVRAQRAFLKRVVTYLADEAGIRQFLDIGTGIPASDNTHEVAQSVAPECRVVYVDNDPMVLAHARALLEGTAGRTAFLDADLRDTDKILGAAAQLLDFRQPVALLLIGILQLIPDEDGPYTIIRRLLEALPSGSWLAIAHPTQDVQAPQMTKMARRHNERASTPTTLRTLAEISRFLEGSSLLDPGVVQLHRWRPASGTPASEEDIPAYCGLGYKP